MLISQRELSNRYISTDVYCFECRGIWRTSIEAEHASAKEAWRIDGRLVITCPSCRNKRKNCL